MFRRTLILACFALAMSAAVADEAAAPSMKQYVIEREIPGAGKMTPAELRDAAAKSNQALHNLGPNIQWVHSYVTGDRLYCVYNATSEEIIRKHAQLSGFPASRIVPVTTVIDPTTAN